MLTVHRPPSPIILSLPVARLPLDAHPSPLRVTPFAPSLSVCHEMHVKTYLVRFPRGGRGRERGRAGQGRAGEDACERNGRAGTERDGRTLSRNADLVFSLLPSPASSSSSSPSSPLATSRSIQPCTGSRSRRNHRDRGGGEGEWEGEGKAEPRANPGLGLFRYSIRGCISATEEAGSRDPSGH
jgi:hypothetical protein